MEIRRVVRIHRPHSLSMHEAHVESIRIGQCDDLPSARPVVGSDPACGGMFRRFVQVVQGLHYPSTTQEVALAVARLLGDV